MKWLTGDTARAVTSDEVKDLHAEAGAMNEVASELTLENSRLEKGMMDGETRRETLRIREGRDHEIRRAIGAGSNVLGKALDF
jgi:hypothetical protein